MAANLETLRFVLFGDDRASSAFNRFARNVDDATKAVDKNNTGLADSRVKLDLIAKKAEELGRLNPDVKVQIDDYAAKLKLAVLKHELRDIGSGPPLGGGGGLLGGVIGSAGSAGGAGASGLAGIASLGPVSAAGLAAVGAAAAVAALALAPVAAALIPITLGFGTLAAVAVPEVSKVFTALTAKGKDLKKALADLSPAEKDIVQQGRSLKDQFTALGKAVQPDILKAFASGMRIIKDLMPALKPLVEAAAKALDKFLKNLVDWLESPQGQSFINWLKTVGPRDIANFGRVIWDVAKTVGQALNQIYRAGSWIDRFLTHWHDDWVLVKTSAQLQWDYIKIGALKLVSDILGAFTHIPIIGGQFKKARDAINVELGRINSDVRRAIGEYQNALDNLHGEKVSIQFTSAFVAAHGVPVAPAAKGMRVPGFGGGDRFPALLEGGEAVVPKHLTPQVAPFLKAHGVPGFAAGGIAGGWNVFDFFNPRVAASIARMNAGVNQFENAGIDYVKNHPFKYWKFGTVGGVPGSVASYAGTALAVLRMLGQPAVDLGVVLRQMQSESGGNPYVVNKWDSNWLAGHPSVGLMQVIRGTFDAYAGPYRNVGPFEYGVSVNPLANIYAGLNYAVHRYGAAWTRVLGQGHGYDQGGWLPTGLSLAYNGTGKPERVGGGDLIINNLYVTTPDGTALVRTLQKYAESNGGIRLRIRTS